MQVYGDELNGLVTQTPNQFPFVCAKGFRNLQLQNAASLCCDVKR